MYWVVKMRARDGGDEEKWYVQAPYSKKRTKEILVAMYAKEYEIISVLKDTDPNAGVKVAPIRQELIDGLMAGEILIGGTP